MIISSVLYSAPFMSASFSHSQIHNCFRHWYVCARLSAQGFNILLANEHEASLLAEVVTKNVLDVKKMLQPHVLQV